MLKRRSTFRKILIPVSMLILLEIMILIVLFLSRGLIQELKISQRKVQSEKVISRKISIENDIINSWMNIDNNVEKVNQKTQEYLKENHLSIESVCKNPKLSSDLLTNVAQELRFLVDFNRVTGSYIILNINDLDSSMNSGEYENKQGIYMKNSNPRDRKSKDNILMMRSPASIAQTLQIPMDANWDAKFDFGGENIAYYDFLYRPFQEAYHNAKKYEYDWKDMGYWGAPYQLEGESKPAITYSVPLILADGTVYGVMGIDLDLDYIKTQLNTTVTEQGIYFLGQYSEETNTFQSVFLNEEDQYWLSKNASGEFVPNTKDYYLYTEPLKMYENNAPFSNEKWVLASVVPYGVLYYFVNSFLFSLGLTVTLMLLVGAIGSLFVSYQIQRPIANLIYEMREKDPGEAIHLQSTGILEIDEMSKAVEYLSENILENGKKLSNILKMASSWLVCFQVDKENNTMFITEDFFEIFDRKDINTKNISIEEFYEALREVDVYQIEENEEEQEYIYEIKKDEINRYVSLKIFNDGKNIYGLGEDVTKKLLEKRTLTHEKEHDFLTNLYNRRGFQTKMENLFEKQPDKIKVGAFVMLDLDNLKWVNDSFGHEYGDNYIIAAARAIEKSVAGKGFYSRISGDEFNIFIYGYESKEDAQMQIQDLRNTFAQAEIVLPDGSMKKLQISGGVSWYQEDGMEIDELRKKADQIMYQVKRNSKGYILSE